MTGGPCCRHCEGRGVLLPVDAARTDDDETVGEECPLCDGSGADLEVEDTWGTL